MPRRSVSVVLPVAAALAAGGAWAGSGLAALPPPPSVTVPTVTVPLPPPPPLPVTVPPPPNVTVPQKAEAPPEPAPPPPTPAVEPPAAVPHAVPPPSTPPALRTSRSGYRVNSRSATKPRQAAQPAPRSPTARKRGGVARPAPAAPAPGRVNSAAPTSPDPVQGPAPEGADFFAPIGSSLATLAIPAKAIPPALFAMAALAILLLTLASAPFPARTSRTGAMLVHMRGSIAVAGMAALMMSLGTYFLL